MSDERVIVLGSDAARSSLILNLRGMPVDGNLEVAIRKARKTRSENQNRRLWGAILRDVADQAWVDGRQYSADTWHEHFKREYLPEGDESDFASLVKNPDEWVKWEYMPDGDRRCVGSTTKLTKKGMMIYQTNVEAYCCNELGVRFSANARFEK